MKLWIAYIAQIVLIMLTLTATFGCSMCCGPYDYDYPNFGGKHPRADRKFGRVGSVFSDPNANFYGPSADSNIMPVEAEGPKTDDDDISSDPDTELDIDAELERLRNENEIREEIDPMQNGLDANPEELPSPDGPTASRTWQNRPLRANQSNWR